MKKVLVVDDSALMRKLIGGVLTEAGYAVHTARHGAEGVEQLLAVQPDVVTLDINMPEMDGLSALSLMMAARPTPVVMVSSLTEKGALATFEALALGAVDFIAKPGGTISLRLDDIKGQLLDKVASASRARVAGRGGVSAKAAPRDAAARPLLRERAVPAVPPAARVAPSTPDRTLGKVPGLVLVGVSTGGPRTLEDILPKLPAQFPWPVLIAQHMPLNFTDAFARRMDGLCGLTVREVAAPMPLRAGHVYIGRAGTDLTVSDRGGQLYAIPRPETAGMPWHPSVDVLVDSAMKHLPPQQLVGVMLTGMGYDGAAAMTRLRQAGGRTIAESSDTAVVFGMPNELIQRGGASLVLPCTAIAGQLRNWLG